MGLFSKKKDLAYYKNEIESLFQNNAKPGKINRVYKEAIDSHECRKDPYGYATLVLQYIRNQEFYQPDSMIALCNQIIEMLEELFSDYERDSRLFEAMYYKAQFYYHMPDDVNAEKMMRSCLELYAQSDIKPSYQNWILNLCRDLGFLLFNQNKNNKALEVINYGIYSYSPSGADAQTMAHLGMLYDKALMFDLNVERAQKGVEILESYLLSHQNEDNGELRGSLAWLLSRIALAGKSADAARASLRYAEPMLVERNYDMIHPIVFSYYILGEDEAGAEKLGRTLKELLQEEPEPEIIFRTEDLAYEVFIPLFEVVGYLKSQDVSNLEPWLKLSTDMYNFLRDDLWWNSLYAIQCGDRPLQNVICEKYDGLWLDSSAEAVSSSPSGKDIFISYSRKDTDAVNEIVHALEQDGFTIWIDRDGIESGDAFKRQIVQALDECKIVLFFSSEASNKSPWTEKEINVAIENHLPIIPIRLDMAIYNPAIRFDLSGLDYIDLTNPQKKAGMIERLKKALRAKLNKW